MRIGILGGGLSGVVMAYLLQDRPDISEITILEKENTLGGLCRSFQLNGVTYDIGPHILFSRDEEILTYIRMMLGGNASQFIRNAQIYVAGGFVKYPFENWLLYLPPKEREYCFHTFINNRYNNQHPTNLLQFFLKTFGEGMTELYFRPYNEKIWKYDPAFIDTQMLGRIPQPLPGEVFKGTHGLCVEGNRHQLNFYHPNNGIIGLIQSFTMRFSEKVKIKTGTTVNQVYKEDKSWIVNGEKYDRLISTIPLEILTQAFDEVPMSVLSATAQLRYNSLEIWAITIKEDHLCDYLCVMVPDKEVVFHRVVSTNFFQHQKHNTLIVESTYSPTQPQHNTLERILDDLVRVKFIYSR